MEKENNKKQRFLREVWLILFCVAFISGLPGVYSLTKYWGEYDEAQGYVGASFLGLTAVLFVALVVIHQKLNKYDSQK